MTKLGEIEMGTVFKLLAATAVILLTIVLCGIHDVQCGSFCRKSEFKEIPSPTAIATPTPIPTPAYPSSLTYTDIIEYDQNKDRVLPDNHNGRAKSGTVLIMRITSLMIYKTHTHHPLRAREGPAAYLIKDPVLIAQHYSYTNYRQGPIMITIASDTTTTTVRTGNATGNCAIWCPGSRRAGNRLFMASPVDTNHTINTDRGILTGIAYGIRVSVAGELSSGENKSPVSSLRIISPFQSYQRKTY